MKLNIQGQMITLDQPKRLADIAHDLKQNEVLSATVDGRLRELSYIVSNDATIEFLGYDHSDAIRIYETTLRYVIAMAINNLYPDAKIRFNYSISHDQSWQ